nr:HPP family protein [Polynucleobacter sp. 39-46-10]
MRQQYKKLLKRYSFYLGGDQPQVPWVERIRSVVGAFIGLILVLTTAKYLGELSGLDEWLMASLGASALLVFALPGSPMAQPWAVIADFGDVYLALPAPTSSCSSFDCGAGPRDALPLCLFPGNGRFNIASHGWDGLQ